MRPKTDPRAVLSALPERRLRQLELLLSSVYLLPTGRRIAFEASKERKDTRKKKEEGWWEVKRGRRRKRRN